MRTIDLTVRDVYRAGDVDRWQIVRTARRQSIAEHSYNVAMIVRVLCKRLGCPPDEAVAYALVHDLPEVVTGDIATPLKRVIGEGLLQGVEGHITVGGDPIDADNQVKWIVKQADLIEAAKFLEENACDEYGRQVLNQIKARLTDPVASKLLVDLLYGPWSTLDDML